MLGRKLSEYLADRSKFLTRYPTGNVHDLQRVALDYEIKNTRGQLVADVKSSIHTGKKPSAVVTALAKLNFPIIITTNYDQLFERALRSFGKEPVFSVYKKNEGISQDPTDEYPGIEDPTAQSPFLLKIHGDVDRPDSIVITDEDYIHFVLRMRDTQDFHPVPLSIMTRLKQWATLFVGYSLMDYNLRLLFKTLRWKVDRARWPETYSIDRSPDPLIFEVYHNQRGYVKYVVSDVWSVIPQLYKQVTGTEMPQ